MMAWGWAGELPGLLPGGEPGEIVAGERRLADDGVKRAQALAAYWAGLQRERAGDRDGARARYGEVLRLDPGEVRVAVRLAEWEAAEGRWQAGLALLDAAAAAGPLRPDGWLAASDFCLRHREAEEGLVEQAVQRARDAADRFPAAARAQVHLILMLARLGRPEEAGAALEQAMARDEKNPRYWLGLSAGAMAVNRAAADGRDDLALAVLRKAQELAPGSPEVLGPLADYLATQRKLDEASTVYRELVGRRPDDLGAREKLARTLALAQRQAEAIEAWQDVLEIDPQHESAHRAMAAHFNRTGDRAASVRHRAEALRWGRDESLREALALVRDMLLAGLARDALPVLERAEFKAPQSPEPPYLAALAHQALDDLSRALAAFERAAQKAAEADAHAQFLNEGFFFEWALAASLAGRIELAEEKFREAIARVPASAPELAAKSYNGLAYLWIERGVRLDEAAPLVQRALKLDPENAACLDTLGWYHFKKGEFAEALGFLERAEAASSDPVAEIGDHRAQALRALGRHAEAIALLETVAQRPDATPEMKQRLADWREGAPEEDRGGARAEGER